MDSLVAEPIGEMTQFEYLARLSNVGARVLVVKLATTILNWRR